MISLISNIDPRRDENGNILEAFEGTLLQANGRFYLYGIHYTDKSLSPLMRCSRRDAVRCYSSADLVHWKNEGAVLADRRDEFIITPKVVYNRHTQRYVMWYNVLDTLWDGEMNVATSDRPEGPFITQARKVPLGGDPNPGCVTVFVDNDDTAYIIYNNHQEHLSHIERLTPDYLAGTGEVAALPQEPGEGQIHFRRGDLYYFVQGKTCCYCAQGTNSEVHTASNPMGPYVRSNDINPIKADGTYEIAGQLFGVSEVQTPDGPAYLWMATRWQTMPDGVNGHDFTYFSPPLEFEDDGTIKPLRWTDSFDLDLR